MTTLFGGTGASRRLLALVGLTVVVASVINAAPRPALSGAGLQVLALTVVATAALLLFNALDGRSETIVLAALAVAGMAGAALMTVSSSAGATVYPFVAVFAAGRVLEARRAVAVTALTMACLAVTAVPAGRSPLAMLSIAGGIAATFFGGRTIREFIVGRERAELLLAETQVAREEQARSAALAERARIAREIHDVLAHSLSALAVQLEGTRLLLANGGDSGEALVQVEQARRLARQGLDETRQAIGALRGDPVPTVRLLENLVADERARDDAAFAVEGTPRALATEVALTVYRVAQEATTNAHRHAPGAGLRMRLAYTESSVCLTVTNPLDGATPAGASPGGGYGLVGMRERAELLGGSASAGPRDGRWTVELVLPG